MANFQISAPGRIVLCGEHEAVYGELVIMASLDRRTTLKFCELNDERNIRIDFPDVDLSLNVHIEDILIYSKRNNIVLLSLNHIKLLNLVESLITSNKMWYTHEQRLSLQTFFFLLFFITAHENLKLKPFHVYVSTELHIGAGLGSSSSFTVCLAACFMHWARLQRGNHDGFNDQDLDMISNYATCCEQVVQNNNIETDNVVCSHGKMVESKYDTDLVTNAKHLRNVTTMQILLIDSKIRQTKGERAKLIAKLKHDSPHYFKDNRYKSISNLIYSTLFARKCTRSNMHKHHSLHNDLFDFTTIHTISHRFEQLQIYILENQILLQNLGLSHPRIDTICSIAQDYGLAGKITGFAGGFVYILLPPTISDKAITDLSAHLTREDFNVMKTSVSCSGVKIDD